ncbi:regulatory protein RecX [Nocardioides anomalus]|uniref:Regulatory protein RecX n=1 Tax=Nocardioides anomalus TaxID=2712223 RepID=A0A6G6WLH8_9ACTN|nr:regulatory protein RecX [Nocardioides anomalus]
MSEGVDAWTRRTPGERPATPGEDAGGRGPAARTSWGTRSEEPAGGGQRRRPARGRSSARRGRRDREEQRPDAHLPRDPAREAPAADPESVARTILLDQLTGRARSRKELGDKLAAKDVPAEVADGVLDRFEEVGLVDDGAFARTWVSQRQPASGGGKGLARRALAQELRRKGIDDETAREALDELDPAAEEEAARELVRRKLRSLSRVDDATATRRLVGMLGRKGYSSGLAFSVVKDELRDAGREEPQEPHSV